MTIFHRAPAGLVASGVFILGLFCAAATVTRAAPVNNPVMLINLKTGKCLTIAGGVSTDNNIHTVQFDCDSHPSRRWTLREVGGGNVYQIRNVQTGKCLTIAGGVMGYVKAHSNASLIAGGISGLLLLVAGYLIGSGKAQAGLILGIVLMFAAWPFFPEFFRRPWFKTAESEILATDTGRR